MPKYILNSGGLKNQPEKADKFHKEIVKDLGNSPRILLCYFAQPREYWEEKFSNYPNNFLKSMDEGIKPEFELAFPDRFEEQVNNNDAVIIYGGDDVLLMHYLKNYNLPSIWEEKVVAGSSAGSNALVKYFWTCDWRQSMEGLGLLPIKFISHYKSEYGKNDPRGPINWDKAYDELKDYKEDLPMNTLEEGDIVIFT